MPAQALLCSFLPPDLPPPPPPSSSIYHIHHTCLLFALCILFLTWWHAVKLPTCPACLYLPFPSPYLPSLPYPLPCNMLPAYTFWEVRDLGHLALCVVEDERNRDNSHAPFTTSPPLIASGTGPLWRFVTPLLSLRSYCTSLSLSLPSHCLCTSFASLPLHTHLSLPFAPHAHTALPPHTYLIFHACTFASPACGWGAFLRSCLLSSN